MDTTEIKVCEADVIILQTTRLIANDLPRIELQTIMDTTKQAMAYSMRAYLLAMPLETVSAKWPANWLEALKDRFLPAWMKRRFPIRYQSIEKKLFGPICPHQPCDDASKHFQWLQMRTDACHSSTEAQYWANKIAGMACEKNRNAVRQHVMHARANAAYEIISRIEKEMNIHLDEPRKWAEEMRAE
jgi:hypothetical protein